MVRCIHIYVVLALLCAPGALHAQTNAPVVSDSDRFFLSYAKAVRLVRSNQVQEAAIEMDQLVKHLRTSPWLEIALLKHTELIEGRSDQVAFEDYTLLNNRLANSPYFQEATDRTRVLQVALQGAVNAGINRIRLRRVTEALGRYFARYREYPESLVKLSILGYIALDDIQTTDGHRFRYIPNGQRLTPFISYHSYEPIIAPPPEPFFVNAPRIDGTSQTADTPPKWEALIVVPGRADPLRVGEDQTFQGFFIYQVTRRGAIVCNNNRILILPAPE